MKKKTFNRLLDKLRNDPNDMGYGLHSDLIMEAYSDTLAGHKDYLWWNLCFDQNENPVYYCPIDPDAQLRPSPGVCMGDLAVFRTSEDLEIKEKLRQRAASQRAKVLKFGPFGVTMTGDYEIDRRLFSTDADAKRYIEEVR